MPDDVTYYAVVSESRTVQNPSGLARRRRVRGGGFEDEALSRDLTWQHTSAIVESNRDAMDFGLVEISEQEAGELVERFREKWGEEG
jgi:hypothetical protein